jgi:hypothetical protein
VPSWNSGKLISEHWRRLQVVHVLPGALAVKNPVRLAMREAIAYRVEIDAMVGAVAALAATAMQLAAPFRPA